MKAHEEVGRLKNTRLRKELHKRKITCTEAAKTLGICRETLSKKLSRKRPFMLEEALILHETYFPEQDFIKLFSDYK